MNANNLAWMKGTAAYTPGDTINDAKIKAAEQGYKPCADGYAAFITAFGREVRKHRADTSRKATQPVPTGKGAFGTNTGNLAAA